MLESGTAEYDQARLRAFCKSSLPDYMVPHRIRLIDTLPLNQNGKLDRTALVELAG